MSNKDLHIANFGGGSITRYIVPTGGGVAPAVTIGPKSFVTVTTEQVGGKLPWTISSDQSKPQGPQISQLPAMFVYSGGLSPSGAGGTCYLTGAVYGV
jgi:hypothetical protein